MRATGEIYLQAEGGFSTSEVQLRSPDPTTGRDATFGDTGTRWLGSLAAGLRLYLGPAMLELGIRRQFFDSTLTTINGCTPKDLETMTSGDLGHVPGSCDQAAFADPMADGPIAYELIKEPSTPDELFKLYHLTISVGAAF